MIKEMLIAGAGGFIGTCGRYLIGKLTTSVFNGEFPLATFLVNAVGCLFMGIICGYSQKNGLITSTNNIFLITGICGGFTTFSAFANELWLLGDKGCLLTSALYCILSIITGIFCVWLGRYIAT